ncbi:hypothetical protein JAAARDRAFT_34111 [Jaapia argillacea MUCL 33604]|uniref:Uncharacterized protein n=1 Tax=Jaapia argillacea MUCL 33604 TaxID=933084 RepID=A0A067PU12_9AGAM|nr:hypothetical protein JAAARDRAFT_34111 [Jaapia argillacea MUCL 33604]
MDPLVSKAIEHPPCSGHSSSPLFGALPLLVFQQSMIPAQGVLLPSHMWFNVRIEAPLATIYCWVDL